MQIGPHKLANRLIVAPMAGVTDRPFRKLCKRLGAGLAVSEMVASDPRLWGTTKSQRRTDHTGEVRADRGADCRRGSADDGASRSLQRRSRRADHRHQHGLPGQEGVQCRGRLRAAEGRAARRAHSGCGRAGGGRAGHSEDSHRLGSAIIATLRAWPASRSLQVCAHCRSMAARAPAASAAKPSTKPSRR